MPKVFINPEMNVFAATRFRGQPRRFGIKLDDRRRHMYVIGKTGMGKTTMLENMMLNDIYAGHGIGIIDPHGDSAEKIIDYIPTHRLNDVVYFNPADMSYPFGFNILENVNPDHKHLIVAGLMGIFKKIWPDVWSARMEYILNNTLLALLDYPGSTLLGVNRLLADRSYRKKVIAKIKDPIIKSFWTDEFAKYNERYQQEAIAPIQNKVGQFLSANIIRNIVAQVKSTINIREIMDSRKILIMNLSKGRLGEDNSRLLGGMLITKIQLSAMERVDIPETERKDFFLYVDEFQNFATESFAHILSEARKYRLSLIMAHQFVEQLAEEVAAAVFGNVGTLLCFRIGSRDAEAFEKEFEPEFTSEDLVKLEKFNVYLKLMVDGVATLPFSATTLSPIAQRTESTEKVVRISRERYGVTRQSIEEKVMKWSGMDFESVQEEEAEEIMAEKKPVEERPEPTDAHKQNRENFDAKKKMARPAVAPVGEKPREHRPPAPRPASSPPAPKPSSSTPVGEKRITPAGFAPLNIMQIAQGNEASEKKEEQPTHHIPTLTSVQFGGAPVNVPAPQKVATPPSAAPALKPPAPRTPAPAQAAVIAADGTAPKKRKRKRKKKTAGGGSGGGPQSPWPREMASRFEPVVVDTSKAGELSLNVLKDQQHV
ncbi:MAG TPA: hypothetical protein DDW36_02140 [Candidatus Magasanikbacteria bacterium]|nr:hypothetical protein [Candidatus Magasanikbacteria bacterium]